MKSQKAISFIISAIVLFTVSCKSRISNEKLSEQWWKHSDGFYVGDFLEFSTEKPNNLTEQWISGDTLYEGNLPISLIVKTETRLEASMSLEIESIETGELGHYCAKGTK